MEKTQLIYGGGGYTIDLNGFSLYKNGNMPLFYIGTPSNQFTCSISAEKGNYPLLEGERHQIENQVGMTQDLVIKPLEMPEEFIVYVEDTGEIREGQRILISDDVSSEKNIVKKVIDGKRLLLKERPHTTYDADTGYINILEGKESDVLISNGQIINNYRAFDNENNRGEDSLIVVSYVSDVTIQNVKIRNKNLNQNSIGIICGDNISIKNCYIEGGRNGVALDNGSRGTKIQGKTFFDCSGGLFVSGHDSLIADNAIISSGSTVGKGDGITLLGSASFNTISNNLISGGNCYGIWGLKGEKSGNSISGNVIKANITYGISLAEGTGYTIDNNRLERNSGGIVIENVLDSIITNNQIRNNLASGISIGASAKACIVKNNIMSGNNYIAPNIAGYGGDIVIWNQPQEIMIQDNLMEYEVKRIE